MPKISIIIPTYQHGGTIELCLSSLFGQTWQDFEIIVVNDGSTDNTKESLDSYFDKLSETDRARTKIIHQENKGAPAARNRGFSESQGAFVIFCDADVTAKPEMLEKMLKTLEDNPGASYAYSSFLWGWKEFKLHEFNAEALKKCNYIITSSLMRREHFPGFSAKGGPSFGWDESLKKFQDWDLWLTILEQGHAGVWVPEVLFSVKPRKDGISHWLPSFMYKLPWEKIGWMPREIRKYREGIAVIRKKHIDNF